MTHPIQTRLRLLFTQAGMDVTQSLLPDLLGFTYDDKETHEADEISVTLKDPTGKWASTWKPDGGEVVKAYISPGTTTQKGRRELYCGKFFVDSVRVSGAPRVFEIRAVSVPLNKPIRKKLKTRAWEKTTLKAIAQQIASASGVRLLYDAQENPTLDRQDQSKESDLKFISRLCEDAGLSLKFTDERIVIFDQASYEKKDAIKTFTLGESNVLSWDFESAQSDTYKSVTVSYRDPKQKKESSAGGFEFDINKATEKKQQNGAVMSYTFTDPDVDDNGQTYTVKKRAKSIEEAKRLARSELRKLNLRRVTGSMTVVGDIDLVAGVVIKCKGFGSIDGNFIVSHATHSVSTSGYTTNVTLRRVNLNY